MTRVHHTIPPHTHVHTYYMHAFIHHTHTHTQYTTYSLSMQTDPIGTIVYSLVVRDGDEGTNAEITFALTSPVSA